MYTDTITITNITENNYGVIARGTPQTGVKARVESEDLQKKDSNGNLILYKKLIILPPGKVISKGDEILITKIAGIPISDEPTVFAEVVYKAARFSPHHIEVWCK